jgi:hypothetical protein
MVHLLNLFNDILETLRARDVEWNLFGEEGTVNYARRTSWCFVSCRGGCWPVIRLYPFNVEVRARSQLRPCGIHSGTGARLSAIISPFPSVFFTDSLYAYFICPLSIIYKVIILFVNLQEA